jgi:hypothetical protein
MPSGDGIMEDFSDFPLFEILSVEGTGVTGDVREIASSLKKSIGHGEGVYGGKDTLLDPKLDQYYIAAAS